MAKVFLDTNIFMDAVEHRKEINYQLLEDYEPYISPLSIHILFYVMKRNIPYVKMQELVDSFFLIPFNQSIVDSSLLGPTKDFEDNVQLHSSAEEDCNYFLTSDEKILSMKFFGKTRILSLEEFGEIVKTK